MRSDLGEIVPFEESYRQEVISVWERSVRATHLFLAPEDLEFYRQVVKSLDFTAFPVYCYKQNKKVIGFLGVAEKKLEMLFLDPAVMGKGIGKRLMNFALTHLQANKVDVNEQNEKAVSFYQKFGFKTYERTEKDDAGKNYPILKMKLSLQNQADQPKPYL